MLLNFIGKGSAFNTALGNNSAYYKKGNKILIIDCGSETFKQILESNILEDINEVHILITHTHPDHIGSLGDLVFYTYFSMGEICKPKMTIYSPKDTNVPLILNLMGVEEISYTYVPVKKEEIFFIKDFDLEIIPIKVKHTPTLECYAYLMKSPEEIIYYSGDSVAICDKILEKFKANEIDRIYHDVSFINFEGNPHMFYGDLKEIIPFELRKRVFLMHLDKAFDAELATNEGFSIVE